MIVKLMTGKVGRPDYWYLAIILEDAIWMGLHCLSTSLLKAATILMECL